MPFICYVYRSSSDVPYMEVVNAQALAAAEAFARSLLRDRPDALAAEVYLDNKRLMRVTPEPCDS